MTHRLKLDGTNTGRYSRYEHNHDTGFWLFVAFLLLAVVGLAWFFVAYAAGIVR